MSVFFAGKRPKRICEALSEEEEDKYLEVLNQIPEVSLEELAEKVKQVTVPVVELENPVPFLRTYPMKARMETGMCSVSMKAGKSWQRAA